MSGEAAVAVKPFQGQVAVRRFISDLLLKLTRNAKAQQMLGFQKIGAEARRLSTLIRQILPRVVLSSFPCKSRIFAVVVSR